MSKDHLSLLNGKPTRGEEVGRQSGGCSGQTEITSVVWDRLVKEEGMVQQPWHYRLQARRSE
ncbi:hypothetical protein JCM10914A_11910 [Paenibacillus sp. JCM 10914]|uniref:hypothetical protein n=1 Tax=Paenibacillus sp. JCM 10914 TaxID=1236974 RepID=UPI0003CC35ED|nr:hypothetical protein [Paenibacillus sp. JCM 10914]GAE09970.1 hypothetical protein JCM10914_6365 [Paenibacillus sp. JCM 10914]